MVSYYNHVAMLSRTGSASAHHHHHHPHPTAPNQPPYFPPAAYGGYAHTHSHLAGHHQSPPTAQYSPNMAGDFNCNHQYHGQFGAPDAPTMAAAASWHQPNAVASMYGSACAAARSLVHPGYEDLAAAGAGGHPHPHYHPHHGNPVANGHPYPFYQQQSSPHSSSSPSPHSPSSVSLYNTSLNNNNASTSSTPTSNTPNATSNSNSNTSNNNNNNSNNNIVFKTEFGPCSGGNPQESSSQEITQQSQSQQQQPQSGVTTTVGPTPHSPDSGMAISDGVSSSGSPASAPHQLPHHTIHQQSNGQQSCLSQQSQHNNLMQTMNSSNPNNLNHQNLLINGPNARPAQARSPYEWMKKPTYNINNTSTNSGKTRTKDKYRVVYSDYQRLELEKEFHYSRYITIRRKAELASTLGLSERQVKIWFQNRRAKERKIVRKREEMIQREKIAMVHMQNAAVVAATGGAPMCNQPNGAPVNSLIWCSPVDEKSYRQD